MSIKPTYKSRDEAKKAGWFSRRHQTSAEHLEVKRKREEKRGKKTEEEKQSND